MRNYVVATSSTCDLDKNWLEANDVPYISYSFSIGDKEYKDLCDDDTKDFITQQMEADNTVTTACVPTFAYIQFFEKFASQGKDVLMLDMTSALSSSHNNAILAAREVMDKYPDVKIEVPETSAVTLLLGLLVKEAVQLRDQDKSFSELLDWVNTNKLHFNGHFMVGDLKWLRRGGRLSNASAVVGTLLSVKPLIEVDKEGKLIAYAKIRGEKKARHQLISDTSSYLTEESNNHEIALIYAGNKEEGETFLQEFKDKYPTLQNINLYRLGPVIMSHIGPGFLAIVVYGKDRT